MQPALDQLIARNLNGFPEPNAQDTPMARRCYYFTKGVLVFRPYLDCSGCAGSFSLEDIPPESISKDPSQTEVRCPSCATTGQMKLKVMAMETELSPGLVVICERDILKCDLVKELPKDAKATDFGEEVDYLFPAQLQYKLAKFMLGQPLLLITSIELIKHQPTFAYNLRTLENMEDMMLGIVANFVELAGKEAKKTEQTSISIGEILPSNVHLPDELEQKEELEAPAPFKDCNKCSHPASAHFSGCMLCSAQLCSEPKERTLTTYVWKNHVSKGIELHTYHERELVKPGGIYREDPSVSVIEASLKQLIATYPRDKHLFVITHTLWEQVNMPHSRSFTEEDRWVFQDPKEGSIACCRYCTAPFIDKIEFCSECEIENYWKVQTSLKIKAAIEKAEKENLEQFIERQEAEAKETVEKQMEQLSIKEEEEEESEYVEIQDHSVMYVRRKDKNGNYKTIPLEEADKLTDIPEE